MDDKNKQLARLICQFCESTMLGHESGFYKACGSLIPVPRDKLKTGMFLPLIRDATCSYLNNTYRSLIIKNDPYIIQKFGEMQSVNHHSAICLLNIIAMIIMNVHFNLDRENLDITSYDKYMESIKAQINDKLKEMNGKLTSTISHECHGVDISTCNPNEPMFH